MNRSFYRSVGNVQSNMAELDLVLAIDGYGAIIPEKSILTGLASATKTDVGEYTFVLSQPVSSFFNINTNIIGSGVNTVKEAGYAFAEYSTILSNSSWKFNIFETVALTAAFDFNDTDVAEEHFANICITVRFKNSKGPELRVVENV